MINVTNSIAAKTEAAYQVSERRGETKWRGDSQPDWECQSGFTRPIRQLPEIHHREWNCEVSGWITSPAAVRGSQIWWTRWRRGAPGAGAASPPRAPRPPSPRCPDPPWPPAAADADASSLRAAGPALPRESPPNPVGRRSETEGGWYFSKKSLANLPPRGFY